MRLPDGVAAEAAEAAENKLEVLPLVYAGDHLRAASLWAQLDDWPRAVRLIERGLWEYPNDPDLNRALGEGLAEPASARAQVP